ncbi:ribosome maturation factor RimP [Stackebrandtia endophytica]|uniref:Ribosome maturation factor RimP n=1 Tax=Stackebrandtia endophytica TaxID=1496996 RepID=A0A543B1L7_9ACTN|nr:ribosome maturation factor RimP [Stackebrandtia endophytica]TQL78738.1 ribosome maturation factor RimP [Stackebrandtia endophytica]
MSDSTRRRIQAVIEPVLVADGYDLEDLKVSKAGRRTLVRVLVDRDGGANLDAIAAVSRNLSKALDESEAADGPFAASSYTLEVSSPGVDRPLKLPRHWRRNIGRLVEVAVGDDTVSGRIQDADDEGVALLIADQTRTIAYGDLGAGRIQLEFSRSAGNEKKEEG